MAKTNTGLVAYVKAKVGCYYWYGTYGQMASKSLYNAKKKQYPKYYTASDFSKQIANPKQVFDCAGLIKAYLWTDSISDKTPKYNAKQDYGATGFYNAAKKKGKYSSSVKMKVGTLVFKGNDKTKTHVGVYIGDNKVVEAKGHAYGVVTSKLSTGKWGYYAECHLISYAAEPTPAPSPTPSPTPTPTPEPVPATTKYKVKTHGDTLNLRENPNTISKTLAKIPNGTTINVFEIVKGESVYGNSNWGKTVYSGKSGYCSCRYLVKVSSNSSAEYHTIGKGDTLMDLANMYGTTLQKLLELNNLSNANLINIGQNIKVR